MTQEQNAQLLALGSLLVNISVALHELQENLELAQRLLGDAQAEGVKIVILIDQAEVSHD